MFTLGMIHQPSGISFTKFVNQLTVLIQYLMFDTHAYLYSFR